MQWLTKLHNRRQPTGMERVIFKKLPKYLAACTLVPLFMSVFIRFWPMQESVSDIERLYSRIDIWSISLVITGWTAIFTIAIGCIVVMVMKGPAYVADAYELKDSNYPSSESHKDSD